MTIKTTLHAFYLHMDIPSERAEWDALKVKLKDHPHCMESMETDSDHRRRHIKPLDGQEIELETKHLFSNQWNTTPTATSETGLRVFDFRKIYFPHTRNLRVGHWLEQTSEMIELRANTLSCGYCGKQYAPHGVNFCHDCLGSEYLTEDNLNLLRLLPVAQFMPNRPELTEGEKQYLKPLFVDAQINGNTERSKKRLAAKREKLATDCQDAIDAAIIERDGFLWMMDRGIKTDNVIYYKHTNTFSIGWQKPLTGDLLDAFDKSMVGFPFLYEFKTDQKGSSM